MGISGSDDFALVRVPVSARRSWIGIAVQRFGQMSALIQFLIGATLGFSMNFWTAFLALTIGGLIIELFAIVVGVIGVREGLSTTLLARWTGFGTGGTALLCLMVAIALSAGFGVLTGISADGLVTLFGALPTWAWAAIAGLAVTAIVVYGIASLARTAYVAVPVFMILVVWSVGNELSHQSIAHVIGSGPAGPPMSLLEGAAFVGGSFLVGAVITPDMARFNRSVADVVKQTIVGVSLGEYVIGLAGVLLAQAARTADISAIVVSSVGWIGVLVIALGTIKINDWNLYSASLAAANGIEAITGRRVHRTVPTIVLGVIGTIAAAAGALGWFTELATAQGYVFAPVAGIMVAEYFFVKKWRADLDSSRSAGTVPARAPRWVPATIVVWVLSALFGAFFPFGIAPLNALAFSIVVYFAAGKLGMVRELGGYGQRRDAPTVVSAPKVEAE